MIWSQTITLTTPGGTITFNDGSGDDYWLYPSQCSGMDGAPIRRTVDDAPQGHGGVVFPGWKGARHIVMGGVIKTETLANRQPMIDDLRDAIDSMLEDGDDGTLAWDSFSLTVVSEVPVATTREILKQFVFGLVAPNPDWS